MNTSSKQLSKKCQYKNRAECSMIMSYIYTATIDMVMQDNGGLLKKGWSLRRCVLGGGGEENGSFWYLVLSMNL